MFLFRTYPVIPEEGSTQVRIFSGIHGCNYRVSTNIGSGLNFTLQGIDFYSSGNIATNIDGTFSLDYTIESLTQGCPQLDSGNQLLSEATAHTLFLRPQQSVTKHWYEDELQKSNKSLALVRTLANLPATTRILWREVKTGNTALELLARHHDLYELNTIEYEVLHGQVLIHQQRLRPGGVYALVIGQESANGFVSRMFEVTEPNSMSMLWLIPQYVVMTLGEVMFSVTGLVFSYSQAPRSMKSLIQAFWLLTVAFGNIIVVVVAELKFFQSQANEFFLFAGLMFVDMLIFMWFACYYKTYDENTAPKLHSESKPGQRKLIKPQHYSE
ncbi:solute carrier family 15 member 1-like [Drosophila nasuta]|uniref:solute carrier family 15 member 1-like n=1 Tax=Drosophila nasuta TaxID=42062 RepID=UPI00295EA630|nr:solute carrier family 15 member 1-like [Drosophila nasuta]